MKTTQLKFSKGICCHLMYKSANINTPIFGWSCFKKLEIRVVTIMWCESSANEWLENEMGFVYSYAWIIIKIRKCISRNDYWCIFSLIFWKKSFVLIESKWRWFDLIKLKLISIVFGQLYWLDSWVNKTLWILLCYWLRFMLNFDSI